jgi:hypothetical protein
MPPIATGSEATLKDMIAWPSAIAIIGTQDCRASALPSVSVAVVMIFAPVRFLRSTPAVRACSA